MRLRHFASTCALALAVTLSAPALAHDHHKHHPGDRPDGPDMRPDWRDGPGPEFGRIREDWLVDCHRRIAERSPNTPIGDRDVCLDALNDYYARMPQGPGYGYGYQGTIMVPVTIPAPPCVEHVTTRYFPVARRVIHRPAPRPDKRIRLVPDKRVPIK